MVLRALFIFLLTLSWCRVMGEEKIYTVQSLNGDKVKVSIQNNWEDKKIRIKSGADSICLFDNWYGEVKGRVFSENFILITYSRKGGPYRANTDLVLVCVKDKKPVIALDIAGKSYFDSGNTINSITVDLTLTGDYPLIQLLNIKSRYLSSHENLPDVEIRKDEQIYFDGKQGIFYQHKKVLKGESRLIDVNTNTITSLKYDGSFPAIEPCGDMYHYYFIDGTWYRNFPEMPDPDSASADTTLYQTYSNISGTKTEAID